jgi:hypothetical protein
MLAKMLSQIGQHGGAANEVPAFVHPQPALIALTAT